NSMVKLADYPSIKNFVAVTSDYHIPRASVFLMTYIYSNGLDVSRGYKFAGTMGWANTPTKYESLSMQASGVGSLSGVSVPRTLTVSTLASVVPVLKSTQIKKGSDLSTIITRVYATLENADETQITEGFEYDITDKVEITGYDPDTTGKQEVTFTWSYPGKGDNVASKSATVTIDVMEATDAELAGMIVYYYKALADSSWFNVTAPWLNVGRADADVERILQQLKAQNPEYGAIWQKIVDFWNEANTEGFTNVYHPTTDGEGNYIINTEDMITTFPNDDSLCFFGYGNRMQADGSMSVENVGRCETLLALAEQYPNAYIMLSGGHTAGAEFDSEAGAMFNWLKAHGVAENRMILDEEALSTVGNITNSMVKLADYPSIKYFVAVTSDYHIPRASVFLMTYIYSNGLDESRGYKFAGTMGWANTPTKYESLSMQASGVGQLAGVSVPRTLTVSTPATLTVTGLSEDMEIPGGSDISELITGAVATYQNADPAQITEGFTFDVMNKIEVSGYDPQTAGPQEITVSYTYNSETVSVTYNVNVMEAPEYVFDDEKEDSVTDGKATWTVDSDDPLRFTVHRTVDDDLTFSLYAYIDIDGVEIPSEYVSATEGSLVIAIDPEYMSTLDEGDHVLTVHFEDGSASISLSVERESVIIPDTGDNSRYGMYSLMAVISMILLAVLRRKSYSY
ncbi:MAG: YdcF family protein, partial [Erysipelotrichaceae bacterium]|nr:YdcF family protein [Erysipelotrichaceae bacterium]